LPKSLRAWWAKEFKPEDMPNVNGLPTLGKEEPIIGYKAIGVFLKCHPDTVRKQYVSEGLPVRWLKQRSRRHPFSYASQLNIWLNSHSTKNRKKKKTD
jgi:hypothetical protein